MCRGSSDGYVKHKRNDLVCDPWDSQGNEKNAISISIAFCLAFFFRNENITSGKCKTKTVKNYIAYRESYKPSKLEE